MADRILFRPAEAAELIAISRARCYQLIADGTIPSIRIGGSLRVPAEALRKWVATQLAEKRATPID
jgi:excisionase family DNA binding protein